MLVIRQRMCYHRGRAEERWSGVAWHAPRPPRTGVDPSGAYTQQSLVYRCSPGGDTVHRMTYYFILLHIALIWWVTRKGDHL